MKRFKLYKVGGCVRDSILGESPKDIDFVFEFTQDFLDSVIGNASANVLYITIKPRRKPMHFSRWMNLVNNFV